MHLGVWEKINHPYPHWKTVKYIWPVHFTLPLEESILIMRNSTDPVINRMKIANLLRIAVYSKMNDSFDDVGRQFRLQNLLHLLESQTMTGKRGHERGRRWHQWKGDR